MPAVEHLEALKLVEPKTLIDVGANKGQFSVVARHLFPQLEIHAFEPLEFERRRLASVVSNPIKIYDLALSETEGEATFFIASRADSSSLLRPSARQHAAYGVALKSIATVRCARLADLFDIMSLSRPILIKADVQGGELSVFKGGEDLVGYVDAIYCEASYVALYDSQPLAHELISKLAENGLLLRGAFNQSRTSTFGPTQVDLLFTRAG
jgi:FkbM family methyltransferase